LQIGNWQSEIGNSAGTSEKKNEKTR